MPLTCGHEPTTPRSQFSMGYGEDDAGNTYCFACCAVRDSAAMIETGKATLYMVPQYPGKWHVTNWPGSLSFPIHGGCPSEGRHNIARKQYSARFTGPDGKTWTARKYGDNTDIAHCRRLAA